MWRGKRIRIFSLKRVILSIVVGFMCPVTFLLTLFLIFYFTGKDASENFVMLVAWPRVLWDLVADQPRSDANVATGLLFIAICDTVVYGAITYVILTAVSVVRPKTAALEPPPTPQEIQPARLIPTEPTTLQRRINLR
jgi:hypothetical protein